MFEQLNALIFYYWEIQFYIVNDFDYPTNIMEEGFLCSNNYISIDYEKPTCSNWKCRRIKMLLHLYNQFFKQGD